MTSAIIVFFLLLAATVFLAYEAESNESIYLFGFASILLISSLTVCHQIVTHCFP